MRAGVHVQTVYGLAALTLLVPVFFHWYAPREDEEDSKAWASIGLTWQAKLQLVAFCAFEASNSVNTYLGRPETPPWNNVEFPLLLPKCVAVKQPAR